MTVHIGLLTSEVHASAPPAPPSSASGPPPTSRWETEAALAATLTRLTIDRLRTATGPER